MYGNGTFGDEPSNGISATNVMVLFLCSEAQQVPVDQAIEQTMNRDMKTKRGVIGFSLKPSAQQLWIIAAHERAAISHVCRQCCGLEPSGGFEAHDSHREVKPGTMH